MKKQEIAIPIIEFVGNNNLQRVYQGDGYSDDKRYYYILFNVPKTVDGEIRVFGKKFIFVDYQTLYRGLPHVDKRVFNSVTDAIKFIDLAFVKLAFNEAMKIPVRPKPIKRKFNGK